MQTKCYYLLRLLFFTSFLNFTLVSFAQLPKVLICGAPGFNKWNFDVQAKLQGTGQFSQVSIFDIRAGTPGVTTLQQYDAVLVYTDNSCLECDLLGNNLATYIDGGGGVVAAAFVTGERPLGGLFNTPAYQVMIPPPSGISAQQAVTSASKIAASFEMLGTIWKPAHPVMIGVHSFNGGISSYRSSATELAPGGYRIADWTDGKFLITAKDNVGASAAKRVDLGFYPPSEDSREDFWLTSTDGALIMANALSYVAGVSLSCAPPYNLKVTNVSDSRVKFTWSAPATTPDGYRIRYMADGDSAGMRKHVDADKTKTIIPDLLPGTTYHWQIRTNCGEGFSSWVSGPDFTTVPALISSTNTGAITIKTTTQNAGIQVMPNPNKGSFTLQMHLPVKEAFTTLAIFNSLGQKMWEQAAGKLSGTVNQSIVLSNKLPAGIYTIRIQRSDINLVQKLVIIQ